MECRWILGDFSRAANSPHAGDLGPAGISMLYLGGNVLQRDAGNYQGIVWSTGVERTELTLDAGRFAQPPTMLNVVLLSQWIYNLHVWNGIQSFNQLIIHHYAAC